MAQPFRFQSVLNYRKQQVEQGRLRLAALQQAVDQLQLERRTIEARRANFYRLISERMQGQLNPAEVERHYRYLSHLNLEIVQKGKEIEEAERQVVEARQDLAEALKARKTMEKLQEYEERKRRQEISRQEQSALDDLNITRHAREE